MTILQIFICAYGIELEYALKLLDELNNGNGSRRLAIVKKAKKNCTAYSQPPE